MKTNYINTLDKSQIVVYSNELSNDKENIIFIHGIFQGALVFKKQMYSFLSEKYNIFLIDLRGHGKSDKKDIDYGNGRLWADDIYCVLTHFNINKSFFCCWSFGTQIIDEYLTFYGDDVVKGLILISGLSKYDNISENWRNIKNLIIYNNSEKFRSIDKMLENITYVKLDVFDYYLLFGISSAVPGYVGSSLIENMNFKLSGLDNYNGKIKVIFGYHDNIVLKKSIDGFKRVKSTLDISIYKGTGHMPFFEKPNCFNKDVEKFINSVYNKPNVN